LVEMMIVIGLITTMIALSFNIAPAIFRRSLEAKARAQLVGISLALEQYKRAYGDYPQTDKPEQLFDALYGRRGPTMQTFNNPGRVFLTDLTNYTLSNPQSIDSIGTNVLLDPWSNYYRYVYKAQGLVGAAWTNPGYILYSFGPDGIGNEALTQDPPGGYPNRIDPANIDNIYAPASGDHL